MSEEELYPVALELHILAGMLAKLGKRDLDRRLDACDSCLSGLSFAIVSFLSCKDQTISEIGRHMMIAPPTLVPVVDSLERQGLVRRGQDPHDRRRTPLSVTKSGAEMLERVPMVDRGDALVRSLEEMGYEKARQLLDLLRKLVALMWQAEHPGDRGEPVVDALTESVREQFELTRES